MKIGISIVVASDSKEGIEGLVEAVKDIQSGKFQRDMEYDHKGVKQYRCKATVQILEDKK